MSDTDMVGRLALCSKGRLGIITGRKDLAWGLSWVGIGTDGTEWASRDPKIVCAVDSALMSRLARAGQRLNELGDLVMGPEMPFYDNLPQVDLASRSYVILAQAVRAAVDEVGMAPEYPGAVPCLRTSYEVGSGHEIDLTPCDCPRHKQKDAVVETASVCDQPLNL
jgi:hypothetical protein